jgi:hypothetical protein
MRIGPAIATATSLAFVSLGMGASAPQDWLKGPQSVSVSAANYSQVSGEELYARVNAAPNDHPAIAAVSEPTKPLFYGFVPGEISASDVPLETVYRELATPLAHKGYFNIVYEIKAGFLPNRIDYVLRVNCGERAWRKPTVRTDKVTWGDDGLVSKWQGSTGGTKTIWQIGPNSILDVDREGLSPSDISLLAMFFQKASGAYHQEVFNASTSRDTAVIWSKRSNSRM